MLLPALASETEAQPPPLQISSQQVAKHATWSESYHRRQPRP